MNKQTIIPMLVATTALPLGAHAASDAQAKARPNILWVVTEDMNPALGCYGDNTVPTPTLDKMAAQGLRFAHAYCCGPISSSSRSGFITGMHQTTIGAHNHRSSRVNNNHPEHKNLGMNYLPKHIKTIPELMRAVGYNTFNTDKRDYNFVYDEDAMNSCKNFDEALADKSKPWFGQIHVHGGKGIWAVPRLKVVDEQTQMMHDKVVAYKKTVKRVSPADMVVPPYYPDTQMVREAIARDYDDVAGADFSMQVILDFLKEKGVLENTIIMFWTDHGSNKMPRAKQFVYEAGLHVPLIIQSPKKYQVAKPGTVRNDLVSLIDVSATTLVLGGAKVPDYMEGQDLFADNFQARTFVVGGRDRADYTVDHIRSVRTARFRYIRNYMTDRPYMQPQYRDKDPMIKEWRALHKAGKLNAVADQFIAEYRPSEELYDMVNDPYQIHNLAEVPEYKKELLKHRNILDTWVKETDDKGQYPESAESLLQTMYRFLPACFCPEYQKVIDKYGQLDAKYTLPVYQKVQKKYIKMYAGKEAEMRAVYTKK